MVSKRKRLAGDPATEKHLFGRVRVDKPKDRIREKTVDVVAQRRQLKAAQRQADKMQQHIDRMPEGRRKRDAERALQRYKENQGLLCHLGSRHTSTISLWCEAGRYLASREKYS